MAVKRFETSGGRESRYINPEREVQDDKKPQLVVGHQSILLADERTKLLHPQSNDKRSSTCRHLTSGDDKDNLRRHEQAEWDIVNQLLQHRGFKTVQLADPQTSKTRDVVLLDSQSAVEIREVVKTLMKDTQRRQALIWDLIQSNKELKNDLRQQQSRASPKEQLTSDLEQVHDTVKSKIQEVQGDYFAKCCQQQKQVEQLQQDKQEMQVHCRQLKQKLHEQEKTIVRLKKKLYMVVTEEEQRTERQNKVFHQFHKQATTAHTIPNQQLLDVIDAYETQIYCLQQELSTLKKEVQDVPRERKEQLGNNRKQKYSVLDEIPEDKDYEEYLKEASSKNHQILQKNQNLKQALKSSFSGSGYRGGNEEEFVSTKVEDIDCMQEATCKRLLKGLYRSLKKLSKLVPGKTMGIYDSSDEVSFEDLQLIVDAILDNLGNKHGKIALQGYKSSSPQTLEAIVSHFQKLFDVSSLTGVYPRMNEVYCKLGEMNNAMRNLRQLVGLDESTPSGVLVNMIGKLCSSVNADTCRQVQQLLGTQDVDSIITKLEEHEEFFPAFYTLFQDLLQILEVDSMDHVLPAVCALKLETR